MTFSQFISKINWRLIIVHLLACWFIYYAFAEFWILTDYNFLYPILLKHFKGGFDGGRLARDVIWMNLTGLISILCAFVLSLVISIRKKWFWLNSVLVLVSSIAITVLWAKLKIQFTPWHYLKQVFLTPGSIFDNTIWFFVINGSLLLSIGLSLLFLKPINRVIDGKRASIALMDAERGTDAFEVQE